MDIDQQSISKDVYKSDIKLKETSNGYDVDLTDFGEIKLVDEYDNLIQAINNRLKTSKKELEILGHPDYGSELDKVIGLPFTEYNIEYLKMLVHNSLLQEERIKKVIEVNVSSKMISTKLTKSLDSLDINIVVLTKEKNNILNISTKI